MLDTTQSALSLQMAALERDCGERLFYRTGRGVALTELGTRLAPRARDLLRDAELLTLEMRSAAGVPFGEVTVGLLPSIAQTLVPLLFREVRDKLPNVRLRILEGSNGQLDEWLSGGRLDAALLYRYGKSTASNEETLSMIDSWLVGPKGDVLTSRTTVAFSQLHKLPLILPSLPNGLRVALDHQAQRKRIELTVAVEVDSIPIQKNLAAGGFGFGVLGLHAVTSELAAGTLQAARIVQPGIARAVTLATTTRHPGTLASRAVTAVIRRLALQTLSQPA